MKTIDVSQERIQIDLRFLGDQVTMFLDAREFSVSLGFNGKAVIKLSYEQWLELRSICDKRGESR